MTTATRATLRDLRGAPVPLRGVRAQVQINDLLTSVTLEQTYQNCEDAPIEAVYSFPVPGEAVLHRLEVELGDTTLQAVAVERVEAEQRYEETVESRDAAVMLEQPEPGLYTLSFGNLPAGEEATIRIVYAVTHRWVGDVLRVCVPTVVGQRYGSSPLPPHAVPETDFAAEHPFDFNLFVTGAIADTPFECCSHKLVKRPGPAGLVLGLPDARSFLDRDLVITFKRTDGAGDAMALVDRLPDAVAGAETTTEIATATARQVAMVAFTPRYPSAHSPAPRCVKLVVDCSGSMAGESIAQARNAIGLILSQLREEDMFAIIRFGSCVEIMHRRPVPATRRHINAARRAVRRIDADLGGTEIHQALRTAWQTTGPGEHSEEILLITDGMVGAWQRVVDEARMHRQRVFPVGVGTAPVEAFLTALASAGEGGRAEFVTPGEQMRDVIVRQFQRIGLPRARSIEVEWPRQPVAVAGIDRAVVYSGDTHTVCAWFDGADADTPLPTGDVNVRIRWEDGSMSQTAASLSPSADLLEHGIVATLAAQQRIAETHDSREALALAVRHGLATDATNLLLTKKLDAGQGVEMPAARRVAQMHAAGWGGTDQTTYDSQTMRKLLSGTFGAQTSASVSQGSLHVPAFLRRQRVDSPKRRLTLDLFRKRPASQAPTEDAVTTDLSASDAHTTRFLCAWMGEAVRRMNALAAKDASRLRTRMCAYPADGTERDSGRRRVIRALLLEAGVPKSLVIPIVRLLEDGRFASETLVLALLHVLSRRSRVELVPALRGEGVDDAAIRAADTIVLAEFPEADETAVLEAHETSQ
jgi:Ca-activated chloride channel family protein